MAMVLLSYNNHLSEVLDHNLKSQIPITCLWPLMMEPLDHWSIQTVEGVSHHSIHSSSVCSNERMNWPESYMEELNGVLVFWGEHCNGCRCNLLCQLSYLAVFVITMLNYRAKVVKVYHISEGKKRQTEKLT